MVRDHTRRFVGVVTWAGLAGVYLASTVSAGDRSSDGGTVPVDSVLQFTDGPQVAAVTAVVVLLVVGVGLVARNRLREGVSDADRRESAAESDVLTDRERVCRLIAEQGGRMKQSEIVDSVDWSKAKVSRLLADLEDEGEITKLRLGRENLICLPGNEPEASRSSDRQSE